MGNCATNPDDTAQLVEEYNQGNGGHVHMGPEPVVALRALMAEEKAAEYGNCAIFQRHLSHTFVAPSPDVPIQLTGWDYYKKSVPACAKKEVQRLCGQSAAPPTVFTLFIRSLSP